ncbi:MAG: DNA (cytosine-5-)-methyltransferase, partial [Desulfovibrio sp.]|nr:DNA (cytosine-5-)-methyltransferase [Desulfovibrio sp.]
NRTFTFIDLFAGIGGLRLGFEGHGGKCVYASECNRFSRETYLDNFGDEHEMAGDITVVDADSIPSHDVLLAGFPCQPFSIAGVSKKNALGRPHGFACQTQGTLFFDVARIIEAKRPKAFLLENVKNLISHDRGDTFRVIRDVLENSLGYDIHWRVMDAKYFVPQHRERVFIAGFADRGAFFFDGIEKSARPPVLSSILHRLDGTEAVIPHDGNRYFDHATRRVNSRYTLTEHMWSYLQGYAKKHRDKGNGFGYGLAGPEDVARTLSARYYKDGSEILICQEGPEPRRLTPRECARLMGFPDSFRIPVSDTQAYRQFGNSVVVPLVQEIAGAMLPRILE